MSEARSKGGWRDTATKPRKRAARGTAEERIVSVAVQFFAERGFRASTRELARRMGTTQALLYRYFPTKQALIDRVFEAAFIDRWDPGWTEALARGRGPLDARLTAFYQRIASRFSYTGARLFLRANLDDRSLAARYTFPLNERILTPVIAALRREAGVPSTGCRPVRRAERELAMALHAGIVHLGIRKFVYGSPLPDDLGEHVAFYVKAFLAGAITTIRAIHAAPGTEFLSARLGDKPDAPIE